MKQLPLIRLVLADGTTPQTDTPTAQAITIVQYEDCQQPFAFVHADGTPVDCTGGALIFTARLTYFDRSATPLLSKLATFTNLVGGLGYFQIGAADSGALETTDPPAADSADVDFIDNAGLYGPVGTRWQVLPDSDLFVAPAIGIPATPVTPSPGEPPLGQGAPGLSPVRVIVIINLAITGIPAAQDGSTLIADDRVLLTGQTTGSQNGPWIIKAGAWTRPADFASGLHVFAVTTVFRASEGTARGGQVWECTTKAPTDIVDTDALAFSQLAGGGSGRAPAIGVLGAVDVEDPIGILGSRRRLTFDDIDAAFAITSFASAQVVNKELGDSISNPQFTASYNAALAAATLVDAVDTQTILTPFTSFGYGAPGTFPARSYSVATINGSKNWALHATKIGGSPTAIANLSANLGLARSFYGLAVLPGAYDEAFIEGLAGSALIPGFSQTRSFSSGGGTMRIYFAWPTAFGNPSSIKDSGGFTFPMTKVATAIPVTNAFAVLIPGGYDVWESGITVVPFTLTVA